MEAVPGPEPQIYTGLGKEASLKAFHVVTETTPQLPSPRNLERLSYLSPFFGLWELNPDRIK